MNFFNSITDLITKSKIKDDEFEKKIDEMKIAEKNLINLQKSLQNFNSSSSSFQKYLTELSEAFRQAYGNNSNFMTIGFQIAEFLLIFERLFNELSTTISQTTTINFDTDKIFDESKKLIKDREEKAKKYEKYEEKLTKLFKNKTEKQKKNNFTEKDTEKLNKTILKFSNSLKEYEINSINSYEKITYFIDNRFEKINPLMIHILQNQKDFFAKAWNSMKMFDDLEIRMKQCQANIIQRNSNYNPLKYIKGEELLRLNNYSNAPVKTETLDYPTYDEIVLSRQPEQVGVPQVNSQSIKVEKEEKKGFFSNLFSKNEEKKMDVLQDQVQHSPQTQSQQANSNYPKFEEVDNNRKNDINITYNNKNINLSETVRNAGAAIDFYKQNHETINAISQVALNVLPKSGKTSAIGGVLGLASLLIGSSNNQNNPNGQIQQNNNNLNKK